MRRLEIWLRGPNGLARDRSSESSGGENEEDMRTRDSCCDSNDLSIFRYSFLSDPAAFVVYRSQPPITSQSGVSKFKALATTSKSGRDKNYSSGALENGRHRS